MRTESGHLMAACCPNDTGSRGRLPFDVTGSSIMSKPVTIHYHPAGHAMPCYLACRILSMICAPMGMFPRMHSRCMHGWGPEPDRLHARLVPGMRGEMRHYEHFGKGKSILQLQSLRSATPRVIHILHRGSGREVGGWEWTPASSSRASIHPLPFMELP